MMRIRRTSVINSVCRPVNSVAPSVTSLSGIRHCPLSRLRTFLHPFGSHRRHPGPFHLHVNIGEFDVIFDNNVRSFVLST
jgi:hypothetical protein